MGAICQSSKYHMHPFPLPDDALFVYNLTNIGLLIYFFEKRERKMTNIGPLVLLNTSHELLGQVS